MKRNKDSHTDVESYFFFYGTIFQRTGLLTTTKKHLQLFYGRKIRQAKLKGDEQRLRAITNYAKKTGGGPGLSAGKPFFISSLLNLGNIEHVILFPIFS
jgi:hypothetical protein